MSDNEVKALNRGEVFAQLASRGADRAVVRFSGGNDEGGADAVDLYREQQHLCTISAWSSHEDATSADAPLVDALSQPVFKAYGTFAGDFDVTGEVIWDVKAQTVQMIRDERCDYEHSEEYL